MKHIKKKFLLSKDVTDDGYKYLQTVKPKKDDYDKYKAGDFNDYVPHILTDKQKFIQCFKYNFGKKTYFIPEPNPIAIYFSNAQNTLSVIRENRDLLFDALNKENDDLGSAMNYFYNYFGNVSNYVTSLFNSIEAFLNHQIPNDYTYIRETKKNTLVYNKEQIQRELSFEDKIKRVIPQIKKKSFHRNYSHKYEIILNFKEFRDEIVHTKVDVKNAPNFYKELFSNSLNFDFLKTIETVRDYLNYYDENLIEKCDCGEDF